MTLALLLLLKTVGLRGFLLSLTLDGGLCRTLLLLQTLSFGGLLLSVASSGGLTLALLLGRLLLLDVLPRSCGTLFRLLLQGS